MPDEEIDNLIRDAANQHHPPYDDKAWGKMAVLLDKHLPQKKDRKKYIFFILFFLLVGSAVIFSVNNAGKKTTTVAANQLEKKSEAAAKVFTSSPDYNADKTTTENTVSSIPASTQKIIPSVNNINAENTFPATTKLTPANNKNTTGGTAKLKYSKKGRFAVKVSSGSGGKKPATGYYTETDLLNEKNKVVQNSDDYNTVNVPETLNTNETDLKIKTIKTDSVAEKTENITAEKEKLASEKKEPVPAAAKENNNKNKKFADRFAVTLSAGEELSYIHINNSGKLKPFYGAGLSYNLSKRFTLRSGLFVSKKVYSATPAQYKFAAGTAVNPWLQKINADCNVYEIPLMLQYNFKQVKYHNWFVGMGISSFLMKKETYDYQYKSAAGQTWSYKRTYNNENENYFSVLTLSGGYQYNLNNHFSFLAEPFLKIPINGIGAGKVKLNSAGLLVTAAVKPFTKKKK
jgi:Outer membrane protein beta-barrel domain